MCLVAGLAKFGFALLAELNIGRGRTIRHKYTMNTTLLIAKAAFLLYNVAECRAKRNKLTEARSWQSGPSKDPA